MRRRLGLVAIVLVLGGCSDQELVSPVSVDLAHVEVCDEYHPENCPQPGGGAPPSGPAWQFLGPLGDSLYEAPGGDSVTPGLWLGANVTPQTCFGHLSATPVADADHDFLADHCEYELARAFSPSLRMDPGDVFCGRGEPHWAAKYFLDGNVRIAYMPAYYDDCGGAGVPDWADYSHHGDSEFIMVEVAYSAQSARWEFRNMFLTAHWGKSMWDQSEWVTTEADFAIRALTHPVVWVAKWKHANYKSRWSCDNFQDDCSSFPVRLRLPVLPTRNVGSMHNSPYGCATSTLWFAGSGRTECFYTEKTFHGWYPGGSGSEVTPYHRFLVSAAFEKRCPLGYSDGRIKPICTTFDWGPSAANPIPNAPTVVLSGPTYAYNEPVVITASASATGLHYEWQYTRCTTNEPHTCQGIWTTFASGQNTTSVNDYITNLDVYHSYRVAIRYQPGGAILRWSPVHAIYGAGETEGGSNCDPGVEQCNAELRAAPTSPTRRKSPPKVRGGTLGGRGP